MGDGCHVVTRSDTTKNMQLAGSPCGSKAPSGLEPPNDLAIATPVGDDGVLIADLSFFAPNDLEPRMVG